MMFYDAFPRVIIHTLSSFLNVFCNHIVFILLSKQNYDSDLLRQCLHGQPFRVIFAFVIMQKDLFHCLSTFFSRLQNICLSERCDKRLINQLSFNRYGT